MILHIPKISNKFISIIIYAENLILMPHFQFGLRKLFATIRFVSNSLNSNKANSKGMLLSKKYTKYNWPLARELIELVNSFPKLRRVFISRGTVGMQLQKNSKGSASSRTLQVVLAC